MQTRILNNPNITPKDKLNIIVPICSVIYAILQKDTQPLTTQEKTGIYHIVSILSDLVSIASHEIDTGKPIKDSDTLLKEMDDKLDTLFNAVPK